MIRLFLHSISFSRSVSFVRVVKLKLALLRFYWHERIDFLVSLPNVMLGFGYSGVSFATEWLCLLPLFGMIVEGCCGSCIALVHLALINSLFPFSCRFCILL